MFIQPSILEELIHPEDWMINEESDKENENGNQQTKVAAQ